MLKKHMHISVGVFLCSEVFLSEFFGVEKSGEDCMRESEFYRLFNESVCRR